MPPSVPAPRRGAIRIRGARTHNLRALDVDIPRDSLVVVTGVSGSGKSSLAFDTLFAEGQRRFLETLSASTRQFVDQMQRPEVDDIEGLPPTLSVSQHTGAFHKRSTLATMTEIHDFLRLLFARLGTLHCPQCGRAVSQQSPQAIVDGILSLEAGQKVMILATLVRGRKGKHKEVFERIVREGFVRVRVDGEIYDAATPPDLNKGRAHDIDVIIDRIVVKEGLRARLQESVELALKLGTGMCLVSHQAPEGWLDRLFSSKFSCPDCGLSFPDIEPRTFSFNSPYGACGTCQGLGTIEPPPNGEPGACPECHGSRLGIVARSVRLAEGTLPEFTTLTISEALSRASQWGDAVGTNDAARLVLRQILPEINTRLEYLVRLGLDYLTLDRPIGTLSGGELQRARLAGCLGSGLRGVCYILDEPTIGLHPRDSQRLLQTLRELRDQGNSLVIVEHDLDVVREAQFVLDLGPGAGREGGQIVARGTPAEIEADPRSVTGRYLRRRSALTDALTFDSGNPPTADNWLTISRARKHNLQDLTVRIPLGKLTCVTGVSGSGKSSLIADTLVPLARATLAERERRPTAPPAGIADPDVADLSGMEQVDRLVEIDQSPIGRNARSNPATASGIWDEVRRVFARTRDARLRGFRAARFSFNSAAGRCPACKGLGSRRIGMHFLPDIDILCSTCRGARFNRATLEIKFRGKSVADVLNLRVDEAVEFFSNFSAIRRTLETFCDVGLGYLTLGQSAATLSGGEAQRIRLATELSRGEFGKTLYVLDEPTTGLHSADIERLLLLLRRLVAKGHSVVVVEHQLDVIASAEYVIDLGPEGGDGGGRLVVEGGPHDVAKAPTSHTGRALAAFFSGG